MITIISLMLYLYLILKKGFKDILLFRINFNKIIINIVIIFIIYIIVWSCFNWLFYPAFYIVHWKLGYNFWDSIRLASNMTNELSFSWNLCGLLILKHNNIINILTPEIENFIASYGDINDAESQMSAFMDFARIFLFK